MPRKRNEKDGRSDRRQEKEDTEEGKEEHTEDYNDTERLEKQTQLIGRHNGKQIKRKLGRQGE